MKRIITFNYATHRNTVEANYLLAFLTLLTVALCVAVAT